MEVGQIIYLKPIGNAARRSKEIKESVVIKVGNKYFETEYYGKFYIDTMTQYSKFNADYIAYLSKEEIEIERERDEIFNKMRKFFDYGNQNKISLEKLKKIDEIICSQ